MTTVACAIGAHARCDGEGAEEGRTWPCSCLCHERRAREAEEQLDDDLEDGCTT